MDIETLVVFGVPLAAFMLSLFVSFALGKAKKSKVFVRFGVLWAFVSGLLTIAMFAATGWDGLGYLAALIGVSAPLGRGTLIGGIVGWMQKDNQKYA